jgi:hypothetical protein
MMPGDPMDPLDQELLGHLSEAFSTQAGAPVAEAAPVLALRTAVLARNWRWVPLLAHASWMAAGVTAAAAMAVSAVAVTVAMNVPTHNHPSPAPPPTSIGGTPGHASLAPLGGPGTTAPNTGSGTTPAGGSSTPTTNKTTTPTTTKGSSTNPSTTAPSKGSSGAGPSVGGVVVALIPNQANQVGQPIATLKVSAKGGAGNYTWSASGLPAGLAIDAVTGDITGTPTVPCDCVTIVEAADPAGGHGSVYFTWTIFSTLSITSADTATFTVGQAHSFTVTTGGGPTPGLKERGALPSGVTFVNDGNGTATLSGTPAGGTVGVYPITITAANGSSPDATQTLSVNVVAGPTASLTLNPPAATISSGAPELFTAAGLDAAGDSTGDVTASTTFSIAPVGSGSAAGAGCVANTCTALSAGTYTVTGRDGAATGTATLTVTEPPWTGTVATGFPRIHKFDNQGYYIGAHGDVWDIEVSHTVDARVIFSGTITINTGSFTNVAKIQLEAGDRVTANGGVITFKFNNYGYIDGITFTTPPDATSITFNLFITTGTGANAKTVPAPPSQIFLGSHDVPAPTSPLTLFRS